MQRPFKQINLVHKLSKEANAKLLGDAKYVNELNKKYIKIEYNTAKTKSPININMSPMLPFDRYKKKKKKVRIVGK